MLTDYEQIQNLIGRYAHAADSFAAKEWADLFTVDGSLTEYGVTVSGRDRIRALLDLGHERKGSDTPLDNKHIQTNCVIDLSGDRATATSDLMVFVLDEAGWRVRGCGKYHDEIVRDTDNQWRFKSRTATWTGRFGYDPTNPGLAEVMAGRLRAAMLDPAD